MPCPYVMAAVLSNEQEHSVSSDDEQQQIPKKARAELETIKESEYSSSMKEMVDPPDFRIDSIKGELLCITDQCWFCLEAEHKLSDCWALNKIKFLSPNEKVK